VHGLHRFAQRLELGFAEDAFAQEVALLAVAVQFEMGDVVAHERSLQFGPGQPGREEIVEGDGAAPV